MTWYAYHLFAESSQALLEEFLDNPVMSKGVYWVRDLTDYPWHDARVTHGLPPNGLLVVRPIADPSSHDTEFYREHVISWFDIKGNEATKLSVSPNLLHQDNSDYELEAYPPPAFLKYLKQLSIEHKSAIAFYHCSMWGGDTDIEFAWVFKNGDEVAYSGLGFRGLPNKVKEYRQNGKSIEREGDVLVETLSHLSINLPSPFFALHTRSFEWESFKVERPKWNAG